MSCYSSDLLLRQYSRVKREKGRDFTYKGMKKVYTIVIFEKSPSIFKTKQLSNIYIHAGKTTFNSGLTINMLQEYFIVSLEFIFTSPYKFHLLCLTSENNNVVIKIQKNILTLISMV